MDSDLKVREGSEWERNVKKWGGKYMNFGNYWLFPFSPKQKCRNPIAKCRKEDSSH